MKKKKEPGDAKTLNEVKSFKIKFDIIGTEEFLFTRKVED